MHNMHSMHNMNMHILLTARQPAVVSAIHVMMMICLNVSLSFQSPTHPHTHTPTPFFFPRVGAIRKDGKRLHEQARKGVTAEDLEIQPRTIHIHELQLQNTENFPPKLDLDVSCGGGTYIRSLVRDLGHAVDSVATTTSLRRTQQGPFREADCLARDEWTVENMYAAIDRFTVKQEATT